MVQSLPEGLAVLTPRNHFIFTPSVEYTSTTNDRLVFRGVVIVPGINLGEVDASTDDRIFSPPCWICATASPTGLKSKRVCRLFGSDDRATVSVAGAQWQRHAKSLFTGFGIGDVEIAAALSDQ